MFWKFLIPIIFLCGCQKATPEKRQQIFHMSFPYDANTLDPRKNSDPVSSTIHFMLFEGLTRMTPASTHELALAKSIDVSEDKRTYTFHLRKSLWSDGAPVTANDFVYAWKTLLNPDFPSPNAHLFYPIKNAEQVKKGLLPASMLGVRAINDLTLEVVLEVPTPYFLDLTSFCTFSPVPSHIVRDNPRWAEGPSPAYVTNGPFSLKSWSFSSEYHLIKNPIYWDAEHTSLDGVKIIILNNEQTALSLFEQGKLDFYGVYNSIPADWIPELKANDELFSQPVGYTSFLTFNLNHPALQNKHIRRALSLATHRKPLIENITQCNEEVATRAIPTFLSDGARTFFEDGDEELARLSLGQGLRELGVSSLDGLVFSYASSTNNRLIAQAIQQQWKGVLGLSIKLEELDFRIMMDKLYRRDYQVGLSFYAVQYNDQMNILDRFKLKSNAKNYPGWENAEYMRLIDESFLVPTTAERFALLAQAERVMMEELPLAPLYHGNCVYLKKGKVRGLYISPIGSIHLDNISIVEDK